jgi:hypothetical protein
MSTSDRIAGLIDRVFVVDYRMPFKAPDLSPIIAAPEPLIVVPQKPKLPPVPLQRLFDEPPAPSPEPVQLGRRGARPLEQRSKVTERKRRWRAKKKTERREPMRMSEAQGANQHGN